MSYRSHIFMWCTMQIVKNMQYANLIAFQERVQYIINCLKRSEYFVIQVTFFCKRCTPSHSQYSHDIRNHLLYRPFCYIGTQVEAFTCISNQLRQKLCFQLVQVFGSTFLKVLHTSIS